jgi:hypothetical protein
MKNAKLTFGMLIWAILLLAGCHEIGHGRPGEYGGSVGRMERVEGTVTIVDRGHGTFEMGLRDSSKVVFFVGADTRPAAKDRFASLKVGDYVRAEGRYKESNHFDLESLR